MSDTPKYTEYEQFDSTRMNGTSPVTKQITGKQETYKTLALNYNYGTPEQPIIDGCFMEGPPIKSTGILIKENEPKTGKDGQQYIKKDYSIKITFDLQNTEQRLFLSKIDQAYRGAAKVLGKYKGAAQLHHFDPNAPDAVMKNPIYYNRDSLTGEIVEGSNPSLYIKLNNQLKTKSLFADPSGTVISWDVLKDVEMTIVPCIHFESVYIGNKPSLQVKLASAILFNVVKVNSQPRQMATVKKLQEKYSGLADKVSSQLAQLTMDNQDHLTLHQESDGLATLPDNPNEMDEFLGGAPSVSSVSSVPAVTQLPSQTQPVTLNLGQNLTQNPLQNEPQQTSFTPVSFQQPQVVSGAPTMLKIT